DLSTFFAQWLHTTELYDYEVGDVKTEGGERAGWVTRVEVVRRGNGRIPVEVGVVAEEDTAVQRVDGLAEREWVTPSTPTKPKEVVLDPRGLNPRLEYAEQPEAAGWTVAEDFAPAARKR